MPPLGFSSAPQIFVFQGQTGTIFFGVLGFLFQKESLTLNPDSPPIHPQPNQLITHCAAMRKLLLLELSNHFFARKGMTPQGGMLSGYTTEA